MTTQSFLMIPDSISDRILLFDPNNGSLVDDNFIDGSADTGLGIFATPLNAVQVDQEIWVSDQVADAIFRFTLNGQYLGVIDDQDSDGDTDGLDNIRGMEFINGLVYVANGGANNDAPGDGEVVVVFDTQGNNLGFFDTGDPYDIRAYNGELLISDINRDSDGGEDIDRYSINGVNSSFLGSFHESDGETGIDFPQQITLRESTGTVLISGFSRPGGVYEYDSDGNQINFLNAADGFANIVRAAYELGNGNVIWSGGDGVVVTDVATGTSTDIYTVNTLPFRPSARYIEPLIVLGKGDRDLSNAIFVGDQTLDQLLLTQDLNGDGDANDPLEVSVYFDATNRSGIADPTGNIFTILSARDGAVFYGDGDTDSVYRLFDRNQDGDALDTKEASVWFSADNANGLPLLTPNGLAQGQDGAIYIVEADTRSTPNGDFVYRTQDLNGDGDANDAGESTIWLDLKALNPNSSAFEITFIDDVAYIIDSVGIDTNVIYRAEDKDGSGTVEANEATVLIDETSVPVDFALASDGNSLFTLELLDFAGPQSIFRIDDGASVTTTEVWNSTALPDGFELFAAFSIDVGLNGELAITSNGGDASEDNVFQLIDLNGDGDYFDEGETVPYLSRLLTSNVPERPRAVAYAQNPSNVVSEPVFLSLDETVTLDGTRFSDEDIVQFDGFRFTPLFDGSDVGLTAASIDAIDIISANEILLSFGNKVNITGLGQVDDSDIVKFKATSLGETTAGTFEMVLDGSDVGLTTGSEDIDALTRLSDGSLLVSTAGKARVPGVTAEGEDILRFSPTTLGNETSGTWTEYVDGSDVSLSGSKENITALSTHSADDLLLSTNADFNVPNLSGANEDIFVFQPSTLGSDTAGSFDRSLFFDGDQFGLRSNAIAAIDDRIG